MICCQCFQLEMHLENCPFLRVKAQLFGSLVPVMYCLTESSLNCLLLLFHLPSLQILSL